MLVLEGATGCVQKGGGEDWGAGLEIMSPFLGVAPLGPVWRRAWDGQGTRWAHAPLATAVSRTAQ